MDQWRARGKHATKGMSRAPRTSLSAGMHLSVHTRSHSQCSCMAGLECHLPNVRGSLQKNQAGSPDCMEWQHMMSWRHGGSQ
eukprot:1154870-Pelagomonas_calceolata.AAC.1